MTPFRFFKSLGWLLFLNVLVKPLWIFAVDRQVQNRVGHEAYGVYFSLLNLSLVFAFVTDAGLSNLMNRQLAAGAPCNPKQLLQLKGALALAYAVLVLGTAWVSGVRQWALLCCVIGIQVAVSAFNFLRSLITAQQFFQWDAWLSVVDKTLMLLLFLPMLYLHLFQKPIAILFFAEAQLICTLLALGVALYVVLVKKLFWSEAPFQKLWPLLRTVAPFALILLAMAAHNRLDAFLLERLHPQGAYQAGLYAASYRLLDAGSMIGYLVASFLVPFLARHRSNHQVLAQTVATARFGLLLFGIFTSLFLIFFAAPVQQLLYPLAGAHAVTLLQWCLPVLPAYLLLHIYGSVLTALGRLRQFLSILFVAVFLNVGFNLWLIPQLGAVGCCMAALISQYFCAIAVYLRARPLVEADDARRQWALLLFAAFFMAGLFYVTRAHLHPVLIGLIGGGLLVLLALFAYLPHVKRSLILSR